MTTEWGRVKRVFQDALERSPDTRPAFLAETCGDDRSLRAEVESLLLAHERAGSFAAGPAVEEWADVAERGNEAIDRQLQPGDRLGPYTLAEPLGAGGMGDVFKARDTRLGRTVAIKLLPRYLRDDSDLKLRFEREARTLATLSHPHICPVFDVGYQDGIDFLVMEHLEGETLADRLRRSRDHRLQIDEAIAIAIQIASALAAVHRAGIVHRDLKPGNVMLTRAGAKLLDFGLAKSKAPVAGDLASLRTTLTAQGTILGTVDYMPPEQIEGKEADARTDLFAFGLVLFEMLTGRRAFEGDSAASLMAAILEREAPLVSGLQPLAMPALDRIVSKCLAKDPDERWQSAKDLGDELKWSAAESTKARDAIVAPSRRRTYAAWVVAAVAVVAAAITGSLFALRRAAPDVQMTRLDAVTPPTGSPFSFALSSDGRRLVFVAAAEGQSFLWVRSLDQASAQPLAGTAGADYPFWSPDGKSIGFFADGKLKRIDLAGGAPQVIADAPSGRGGTWNREGLIVFASTFNAGLMRVEASGGSPIPVTRLTSGQSSHRWPQFLPDGRRFLFFGIAEQEPGLRGVFVGSLDGGEPTRALADNAPATYAPPGYLLQVSDGALMAHRFDGARGPVNEESVLVAQPVASDARNFRAAVSVSEGVLAYRSSASVRRQLVWVDRTGKTLSIPGLPDEAGVDFGFELSPDGQRVAGQRIVQQNSDIWITDIVRGISSRFMIDPVLDSAPLWSPDGTRLVFSSLHNGRLDLFEKPLNGASDKRPLLVSEDDKTALDWSWDGRVLLYATQHPATRVDLWALPLTGERKSFPVAQTSFDEAEGRFSPDGRWVAYTSNETGRPEIYVRAFPGPGDKWQVSKGGGNHARWRRDGRELFYLTLDKRLMAAPIQMANGRMLSPGAPVELFQTRLAISGANTSLGALNSRAEYAVAPDGRFLMNIATADIVSSPITVVLNWQEELKQRVPTR